MAPLARSEWLLTCVGSIPYCCKLSTFAAFLMVVEITVDVICLALPFFVLYVHMGVFGFALCCQR